LPRSLISDGEIFDAADFSSGARRYYRVEGIVVAFYPGVQGKVAPCVDVQPGVNDVRICTEAGVPEQPAGVTPLVEGQRYSEPWPVLHRIPVRYPSGGGLALWWDLKPGDKVDLESPDLDPSTYRATGQQSDPPFTRRNSGSFWTAIPGSTVDSDALPPAGGAICVGAPGGVLVTVSSSQVTLGASSASSGVGLATLIDQAVTTIVSAFNGHTHSVAGVTAGPATLPSGPPLARIAPPAPTGSKVVKSI
jgi:hypothetical protein